MADIPAIVLGRKAQALAFIKTYLVSRGSSPAIGDIAQALKVSQTRAKALVHALAREQLIIRQPGAHRGISVPGLGRRMQIEQAKALLRAEGVKVDEDFSRREDVSPCPKGHLPIVAVLTHSPEPGDSEDGDGDIHGGGDRAAAARAPGTGRAAPEAQGDKPA